MPAWRMAGEAAIPEDEGPRVDNQRRIAPPGEIVVLWPFQYDEVAWNTSWRKMLPLLKEHGFNWQALISSSGASFSGTRESADFLQPKIAEIDSAFSVRWYPPTDLLPDAEAGPHSRAGG